MPDNVPKTAFWIGGRGGGNWYLVDNVNLRSNSALIKIYDDYTGEIIENRTFILKCNSNFILTKQTIKSEIQAYDGRRIILRTAKNDSRRNCYFE
jgi:hypothetical protein